MSSTLYKSDDFKNVNEVRWCPGCGDYAVLSALQRVLPQLGLPPEKHVFVSGIGCAGRLPYYLNTYGLHTIHGRAPAVATGLATMRPDLAVWVITGDGDALSIGGNHLIHCLRRNVNLTIVLLNNQVYGLTKGQFSPTSPVGQITKTSPEGVNAEPLDPLTLVLASGGTFVARAVDKDPTHLAAILKQAYEHEGCSFVEIYQDCNIFNKGAFDAFALKANRGDHTVYLETGKPLLFGNNQQWALTLQNDDLQRTLCEEMLSHYPHDPSNFLAAMRLARLRYPKFPVPLGIYYQKKLKTFVLNGNLEKTKQDLHDLFRLKASW